MATKSFLTDFKFNAKSGYKLIEAIENSKRVDLKVSQATSNVTKKEDLDSIMKAFRGEN
jgi:hypothetical protein